MKNLYKKIKQYVITRPKLHKVLKIIKFIVNVLVYGFTIFMIIGLCVGTTLTNKNNNDGVVKQSAPSYNVVIRDDYQLYGINSDIITKDFLNALLTYEDNRSGFAFLSLGEMVQYYATYGTTTEQDCYAGIAGEDSSYVGSFGWFLTWDDYNPNNLSTFSNNSRIINHIYIKLNSLIANNEYTNYSLKEYEFVIKFYNHSTLLEDFTFRVNGYFNSSNSLLTYFVITTSPNNRFILVNKSIIDILNSNLMLTLWQNGNPSYKAGYEVGYTNGYTEGFNAESGSNDAFTLIRGAFGAIGDILDIYVLPHLTLGVLIFAPIVVTLIIVIVKMVRG